MSYQPSTIEDAAGAPCEFRLLNGADPILCGLKDDNGDNHKFLLEVEGIVILAEAVLPLRCSVW